MIIADTSGLVALFNRAEPSHAAVAAAVRAARAPLVVSPFVVAEVDHLVATRRLLTLDRRHFEVVRAADGERFELLP